MRIIAGHHRGRALVAPEGQVTRPTADKTRQALFNVLAHAAWAPDLEGARVLDLFAGSGALGLESLSRGAAFALFIDKAPTAMAAISRNLAALRLGAFAEVLTADATALRANMRDPFDLVLLDPPYAKGLCEPALACLADGGWLAPAALVGVERGAGEPRPEAPGYDPVDDRTWGAAHIWFLKLAHGS